MKAAALAALLAALPAAVAAQSYELGRSGDLVVSERLRIFAQGRAFAAEASPWSRTLALKSDLIAQGFFHEGPAPDWTLTEVTARPTLGWSPNLNGGVGQRRIDFAGGWLEVDPAYVAKSGPTMGIAVEGEARLAWGLGRFLEAEADGAISRARESGYERRDQSLGLCSRNHLAGWSFLDLCLRRTKSSRSLSDSEQRESSVQLAQLFAVPGSYHEVRLELGERRRPEFDQPYAGLELHSVWSGLATRVGLALGRPVPGRSVERVSAFTEARWRMGGAATGIALWHSEASGGQLFGIAQEDRSTGIALFRQLTPRLDATVRYERTDSTVALFRSNQIGLDLTWQIDLR